MLESTAAGRRLLEVAATFEMVTLTLMLANVMTVHESALSSVLGPLHGLSYLLSIALTWLIPGTPRPARIVAWIPGIGGALALRRMPNDRERAGKPSVPAVAAALTRATGVSLRARYVTITPEELQGMTRSAAPPTIVDVRLAKDFEAGHIDGAINLPFDEFDDHREAVPRGAPVVTVCYLGMLSRTAAQHLVADGHAVVLNLDRGMKGWRELAGTDSGTD